MTHRLPIAGRRALIFCSYRSISFSVAQSLAQPVAPLLPLLYTTIVSFRLR